MDQYDIHVNLVMEFLKTNGYSASVISAHRICYKELRRYLASTHTSYTLSESLAWLENNQNAWTYRMYTSRRLCIYQLEDVYISGTVSPDHLGPHASAYTMLIPELQEELDDFINNDQHVYGDGRYRISCSRFLYYLQKRAITSISQLNYELLLDFHADDYHRSSKSKDVYEDQIRVFLRYCSSKGLCSDGLAIALNKLMIPQIVSLNDNSIITGAENQQKITLSEIDRFLESLSTKKYGLSVMKYSRHILSLLYIFLDMHHLGINEVILWKWFEQVKPLLGTNWKQARRTLCQFWIFLSTGEIYTGFTGDPATADTLESLPDWCSVPLRLYLELLKREGWKKSTIAMHRSSNFRFCRFLCAIGINRFSDITPQVLHKFNEQNMHKTAEGKAAYNCRIRNFLLYLYDEKLVVSPFLYKALSVQSAPRERIVEILTQDEIRNLWSVNIQTLSPKALRDYAIVCIGLTMGFRASDIVSIRFQDINWKKRSITIIQQKTGKLLEMPMPVRTGNVLFRYLSSARPVSSSPYVFILHEAPYNELEQNVCRAALIRFLLDRKSENKGFHVTRRTFATGLLMGNAKVELISDSLGHSTDSTVHKYLSLDDERMRLCPLSLEETGISWKGGAFHA